MSEVSNKTKKEIADTADKLVFVMAGKNSFIGEFTGVWDGGPIKLRNAIASGMRQVMAQIGPNPQDVMPAQIPTPGLISWVIDEPVATLEVVPNSMFRVKYQRPNTQNAIASMYLEFLETLKEAREAPERKVQLHGAADLAAIERAGKDPASLFSKFGPTNRP